MKVYLQKISTPTSRKVTENSKGEGGFKSPIFLKKRMALKWNFQRGWGVQANKPSVGGVWIFCVTTQYREGVKNYAQSLPSNFNVNFIIPTKSSQDDTYILLTKCEGRTGRISARGLDGMDRVQRGPYKKD